MLERYVIQSEWQHVSRVKAGFEKTLLDLIQKGDWSLAGFSDEELNANLVPFTPGPSQHLHHIHHQHHQSLGRIPSVPVMKIVTADDISTESKENEYSTGDNDGRTRPQGESRSSVIDPRIREKIESLVSFFSIPPDPIKDSPHHYTLNPIMELSTPGPVRAGYQQFSGGAGLTSPSITPILLLCPADFTTLFYFVAPQLRTAYSTSSSISSSKMTRSSSFNGKGIPTTRPRTSSETPPTYPAAMKSALSSSTTSSASGTKGLQPSTTARTHKRASPSFSFFSGATSSLPFKAKPPQPPALEKSSSTLASSEQGSSGLTFLSLSGIKPGQVASPRTATIEVTSSSGIAAASNPCPILDPKDSSISTAGAAAHPFTSTNIPSDTPIVAKHWSDERLMPDLKAAIKELKRIHPGPLKEVPGVAYNPGLAPLREPWALAYVQYEEQSRATLEQPSSNIGSSSNQRHRLVESGLALAPPCMAMVMETAGVPGGPRIITVTKPILVDQVMDSAGEDTFESNISVNLNVNTSDTDSIMSSEDNALAQQPEHLTPEDKDISILRVNSSQMLSATDQSGIKLIPVTSRESQVDQLDSRNPCTQFDTPKAVKAKRSAADNAWKTRIRHTVRSESDLPEEVRIVARSIFKLLREFDLLLPNPYGGQYGYQPETMISDENQESIRSLLLQGINQARASGNHAAAIGFNHSLQVLESSQVLRQLDTSKLIYLLAMPIKHRLEHRAKRASSRTLWEGFAHSWHTRLVSAIERKRENMSSLRIKMYYLTCVRTSRAFEKSFGIVVTLSRLNRNIMRKYLAAEEWERLHGIFPSWSEPELKSAGSRRLGCEVEGCRGACQDYVYQSAHGDSYAHSGEGSLRRATGKGGYTAQILKTSKTRRSSFSTYMDNMTSRSYGSYSTVESNLSHLKEKEQASFSSSYNPNNQGLPWGPSHALNQLGISGFLGEAADVQSDFTMDAREIEAVQRWVTDSGIYNFLPGEDNFLRFCMEVENVVKGIGLGGTGILFPTKESTQANAPVLPYLANNGSDFFVKEVAKFNGQFVVGMGPTETATQAKSTSSASGVAEFIVNSFKHGGVSTSAPSTNQLFSSTTTSSNNIHGMALNNSSSSISGTQPSQSSVYSNNGVNGLRTKGLLRQPYQGSYQSTQDAIPTLQDDPTSIYASQPGPTYALYNPPFPITSHSASTSYASSTASGGGFSTILPHQLTQLPKDMPDFMRRIQLKLTNFLLSEWLDLFGEIEADRWFLEFLTEMGERDKDTVDTDCCATESLSEQDRNEDSVNLHLNQMDLGEKLSRLDQSQGDMQTTFRTSSNENVTKRSANLHSNLGSERHILGSIEGQPSLNDSDTVKMTEQLRPDSQASVTSEHSKDSPIDSPHSFPPRSSDEDTASSQLSTQSEPLDILNNQLMDEPIEPPMSLGKNRQNIQVRSSSEKQVPKAISGSVSTEPYDMIEAYRSTIDQFNTSKSPYQKLGYLFALEQLIVASLSYPDSCAGGPLPRLFSTSRLYQSETHLAKSRSRSPKSRNQQTGEVLISPRMLTPGTDEIVDEIERLFRQPAILRPRNLLRDMQLIAIFIPGTILDLRYDGKAFWDMAMAISILKNEVVEYVVEKGTRYVDVEESSRTRQESDRSGSRNIIHDDEEQTRMSEAVFANFVISVTGAKESHQVAQRELAILYMSLPILPSSSSPPIGYARSDGSPLISQISRVPSPISIGTTRFGRSNTISSTGTGRTSTPPPPPSPKGTISSSLFGKSNTASIPIKQRSRHQHSNSGSGSSFGSGVLSGLGIMTGLGSFTGSSSMGSGNSEPPNSSSTVSLLQHQLQYQQQPASASAMMTEFAEGHGHDLDQQYGVDTQSGRHSTPAGMFMGGSHYNNGSTTSLHPYHHHSSYRYAQYQHSHPQNNISGPDKFNPENLAAAMHWFKLAAAQGDKFSINFLKHKETAGGMIGGLG
ncbi:hypothetical protein FBU30_010360 [Linnemannia zychae]|nr:hypothetical protein FBU30_010360 [Linnemannia zychae]